MRDFVFFVFSFFFVFHVLSEDGPKKLLEKKKKRPSPSFSTVYYNNKALSKLKSLLEKKQKEPKKPIDYELLSKAEGHLYKALKYDSESPVLHFNLGVFLALKNKASTALKEWDFSLKNWLPKELLEKFMTLFNKAFLEGLLGQKKKSLELYQKSLEITPESLEVRTNIELLFQQQKNQKGGKEGGESEGEPSQGQGQNPHEQKQKQNPSQLNKQQIKQLFNEIKQQDQNIKEKNLKRNQKGHHRDKNW